MNHTGIHEDPRIPSKTAEYGLEKDRKDLESSSGGADVQFKDSTEVFEDLVANEANHDIKYRTLSWQKTAILLFGEYVCLAILALAWSWSVLGWVAGALVTFGLGIITWYTSFVQWQYIMKHPEVRDICDIGSLLFGGSRIAYELTAIGLLLNNICLMGFHVLTGSKILNTLSDHSQCTTVFSVIIAIMSIIVSLPRTLNHVSTMSIVSAIAMAIALILTLVFAGIESHPGYGYAGTWPTAGETVYTTALPDGKPGFINAFNATLNITFLWIGQVLYPSFIAEMKRPQDFPKALAALSIMEFVLFMVCAAVGYNYLGQYSTAPLIGSLSETWARKASFAFVLVPTLVIGAIYSNVAAKFIWFRILGRDSRHTHSHTVIGWGSWVAVVIFIWVVAFVLGETIPSMGDFLSILSAAFDSFFGFIFWSVAYRNLNRGRLFAGLRATVMTIINIVIFGIGLLMLGPGMWTAVSAIIADYAGPVKHPFSCRSNAL